jgi:hypothetical protein
MTKQYDSMARSTYDIAAISDVHYLPRFEVMIQSLRRYEPKVRVHLLCLDGQFASTDLENVQIYQLHEIGLSPQSQKLLRGKYNKFQLSCVLKSKFTMHLLQRRRCEILFYADSDLYFTAGLREHAKALRRRNILLTPHRLGRTLQPNAKQVLDDALYYATGFHNMGFFGLHRTPETLRFLQWWHNRVKTSCFRDFKKGLFDDQKWVDAVPFLFDGVISSQDVGLNVAPWNIEERRLTCYQQKYFVAGEPLVFFHFSGFHLTSPQNLCSYLHVNLAKKPALRRLLKEYADSALLSAVHLKRSLY